MVLRDKVSLFLVRLIRSGLFAVPLLPIFVLPQLPYALSTGRSFVFRILIDVLCVLWMLLCMLDAKYRPRWTVLTRALFLFLGVVIVADILGVNPYRSIWSTLPRMDGLITLLHVGVYALILRNILQRQEDWRLFFSLTTIIAIIVAGISILQHAQLFPRIVFDQHNTATLGNTTFLSGYLAFHIFFSFFIALHARLRWQRWVWCVVPIIFLIAIFLASTRAILLALSITGALFVFARYWKKRSHIHFTARMCLLFGTLFLLSLPLFFFAIRGVPLGQSYRPLLHLVQDDAPLGTRPMLWEMAWKGVLERPLLGWGQENYISIYHRYYDSRLTQFEERWADRPHNIILEWLVNAGILGLFAYGGLFFSAYRNGVRALRSHAITRREIAIFSAALFTYAVQNLSVFDTVLTSIFFFSILAYLDVAAGSFSDERSSTSRSASVVFGVSAIVLASFFIVTFGLFYTRPLRAAYALNTVRTFYLSYHAPIIRIKDILTQALNLHTFVDTQIREEMLIPVAGIFVQQYGPENASVKQFVVFATSEGEKEIERSTAPDVRMLYFLGEVYRAAGATHPEFLSKAKNVFTRALRLSPGNQRIWFGLARVYLLEQKPEQAIAIMEGESSIVPLAIRDLEQLADAYITTHRYDVLATLSRFMIARDPLQQNHYRRLWFAYTQQGKKEQARILAERTLHLHPDWESQLFSSR